MTDPIIRPARPEDASFLAWVVQEADRMGGAVGSTDLVFDVAEQRRLEFLARIAASHQDSEYHHRHFLVAEVDGEPAAALSAYVPDEVPLGRTFEAVVRLEGQAAGWDEVEVRRILERSGEFTSGRFFRVPIPGGTWNVGTVATRPEHRRRGLNRALLEALFEAGRARGLRTAHVQTAIGNGPAIAAYQAAGFRPFAEARHSDFEAVFGWPGFVFFRRDL